ncbi:MAG: hypothetical protein AAFW89_04080 [Bacteroidota bacterium]
MRSISYLLPILVLAFFAGCNESSTSVDDQALHSLDNVEGIKARSTTPVCVTKRYSETHLTGDGSVLYIDNDNPIVCPPSDGGDGYIVISTDILSRAYGVGIDKWNSVTSSWEGFDFYFFHAGTGPHFINTAGTGSNPYKNLDGSDRFRVRVDEAIAPGIGGGGLTQQDTLFVKLDLRD